MTPKTQYEQDLQQKIIQADDHQARAVETLQRIFDELHATPSAKKWFHHKQNNQFIKGAYFWGPVGTGKTYLMDLFYRCLDLPKKRLHFHEFMQDTHNELKKLEGKKNPLDVMAAELATEIKVLCFDEFVVNNIVDAMILANLLKALFAQNICLLTTSNVQPDDLYKDGIQRDLFLPAIDLIHQHLEVLEVDNKMDYRLRKLTPEKAYFHPENSESEKQLQQWFAHGSKGTVQKNTTIEIMHRNIPVKQMSENVIWFEFDVLCQVPRSQRDYLAIVEKFHTVIVSGVHNIETEHSDVARLFINLIDVLYNAQTRLIMSGSVELNQMYEGGDLDFEFTRTYSRLVEMQSKEYLAGAIKD